MKIRAVEGLSEDSSAPDISTDSGSGSDASATDTDDGEDVSEGGSKREGEDNSGYYNVSFNNPDKTFFPCHL